MDTLYAAGASPFLRRKAKLAHKAKEKYTLYVHRKARKREPWESLAPLPFAVDKPPIPCDPNRRLTEEVLASDDEMDRHAPRLAAAGPGNIKTGQRIVVVMNSCCSRRGRARPNFHNTINLLDCSVDDRSRGRVHLHRCLDGRSVPVPPLLARSLGR